MRSFGITSGLSITFQLRPDFCTITSGTMMFASARANGRPGLGSSATISACASLQQLLVGAGAPPSAS